MKILFVCHRFPFPPKRGGKIRPFNIIAHLHAAGHELTVAALTRSSEELEEGAGLSAHCSRIVTEPIGSLAALLRMVLRLPSGVPSSMGYFYSPALAKRIRSLLSTEEFDFIFVHCSSVAQYVAGVEGPAKMLDFGDMDSQKWLTYSRERPFPLSMGYRLEATKLERAERALARRFDLCSATTRAELATLDSYGTGVPSGWFPNGVDAEFFQPADEPYNGDRICFVGRMDYFPNQQAMFFFCREVWPLLRKHRPALSLAIVGADPSREIRNLAGLPGVEVTGSVPDVRPWVRACALSVAPLEIARGTQNKILECMAMGVPVVSSATAAGGVDAVPGEHLLTASSAEAYCDAIVSLLENPALREQFAQAGRQRVLEHHAWDHSMSEFDGLMQRCLELRRSSAVSAPA